MINENRSFSIQPLICFKWTVCVLCSLSLSFCHRWMMRLISALISILLISKAWSEAKTLHNSTPSLLNHQGHCSYHPLLQSKLRKSEREPELASETGGGSDSYASVTAEFIFQLHILRNHWSPFSKERKKERKKEIKKDVTRELH